MRSVAAFGAVLIMAGSGWGADDPEKVGARVYAERCSGCHGDTGRGDGPAAAALIPRPRDLGAAAYWEGRTTDQVRAVVANGKPGTMMAPFAGVLSDAEIDAVVGYVRRFAAAKGAPAAPAAR